MRCRYAQAGWFAGNGWLLAARMMVTTHLTLAECLSRAGACAVGPEPDEAELA